MQIIKQNLLPIESPTHLQVSDDLEVPWLDISSTSLSIPFLLKAEKKWCKNLKINKNKMFVPLLLLQIVTVLPKTINV